ncbi:MAG: DUF4391 domain-containing protein [Paraclostridium sp.]|uniref:DUF4391 domain-containing protein n=1 Tax=Paraclostridium sp. TaxID=2023273 RepID=UPI003EE4FD3D
MNDIFEILELKERIRYIGQKITKKLFYQQSNFSKDDEKNFTQNVDKMEMAYVLDTRNINIDSFKDDEYLYTAIGYMRVSLKQDDKLDRICKIINNNIPSPIVIIFEFENKIAISTAIKRLSKSDNSKVVVDEMHITPWIDVTKLEGDNNKFLDSIKLSSLTHSNFYDFYKMIDNRIYTFQNVELVGSYKTIDDKGNLEESKLIIGKINNYNNEIESIAKKIKGETQFNKKMKLNVEANKLKEEIEELKLVLNK